MGHKRKTGAIERDAEHASKTAAAIEGLANGTYTNTGQAAAAVGIAETTLRRRLKGGKTRAEAHEGQQLLVKKRRAW